MKASRSTNLRFLDCSELGVSFSQTEKGISPMKLNVSPAAFASRAMRSSHRALVLRAFQSAAALAYDDSHATADDQ